MPISFAKDIKPLFTAHDLNCMNKFGVDLGGYAYMSDPAGDDGYPDHANARNVLARLDGSSLPRMPMGGPYWPAAQIQLYQEWMSQGFSQ